MLKARVDSVWIGRLGDGDGGAPERNSSGDDPSGDEGADAVRASEHSVLLQLALACDPSDFG
jgi:hypothetical protein